jgi:hypothetical protein
MPESQLLGRLRLGGSRLEARTKWAGGVA